ncbi:glycosyltransferase [Burkholderia multivorans]|uniref:glycosyltransferase n=1 Tax=Burkholderia multivorans TaxID=87883 RepID=UPI0021BE1462|nr:glycosyltransferase [Burkholderia multivorans]MCA8374206.1 glycosyltransferase [Burkholderia multivorans]
MNVLHVYRTYFPDPPGGLQEAIRQIALATRMRGVDARIFTLSPTPEPQRIDFQEGVVVRARSWAAPASCDIGGLRALSLFREMVEWADVLHFHFPWPYADLLNLLGGGKRPSVMTYHSDIVRQKWLGVVYGPLMRWMLGSMDAVVATSPTYAATSPILKACVRPERLYTIPLGIGDYRETSLSIEDDAILDRLGLNGQPFFLALGVLRYYKGLHTLIEAAAHINARIVIAGSGPEHGNLVALAERLAVRNVIFAGQVSEGEKIALLRSCRAMVLPSHLRAEAFGMVLVEAEMFGKPMVCCEVGSGTSYVNEHGTTGLVVEPERPDALADAMQMLLDDDALANRMGNAARARYEAMFSGSALGDAYCQLYRGVV